MGAFRPYVGITGFMSRWEVIGAAALWPSHSRKHGLMIGVLASAKTLAGGKNSKPYRYPKCDDIAGVFVGPEESRGAVNLVHVAPGNGPERDFWLGAAFGAGGRHCHGVQVNAIDFMSAGVSQWSASMRGAKRAVLQLRPQPRQTPADTAALYLLGGFWTDVLIDASGGNGVPLDLDVAREYLRAIKECAPHIGLGVAGGLCAEELPRLRPLVEEFPDLSIDAEGRLRDADDRLDNDKVAAYLAAAAELFGERYRGIDRWDAARTATQRAARVMKDPIAAAAEIMGVTRQTACAVAPDHLHDWVSKMGGFDSCENCGESRER